MQGLSPRVSPLFRAGAILGLVLCASQVQAQIVNGNSWPRPRLTVLTPSGGKVTVRGQARADAVAISVSDTGIGMSEEDVELALTAFGQVDSRMTRRYDGTGLGLPLAKAIVELHRGRLEIDSHPGRGTTVTVALPSAPAPARASVEAI